MTLVSERESNSARPLGIGNFGRRFDLLDASDLGGRSAFIVAPD
jgi:hypothetical protein